MKKLSYWNILYVLAVLACGMGTVSVAGEQGFSLSLIAMVVVGYVCQLVFYGKSQVKHPQKLGYTDMFYILCLFFVVPALVIFLSSHLLYALLGLVLFAGLMFTNPSIHQWWSSIPVKKDKKSMSKLKLVCAFLLLQVSCFVAYILKEDSASLSYLFRFVSILMTYHLFYCAFHYYKDKNKVQATS